MTAVGLPEVEPVGAFAISGMSKAETGSVSVEVLTLVALVVWGHWAPRPWSPRSPILLGDLDDSFGVAELFSIPSAIVIIA